METIISTSDRSMNPAPGARVSMACTIAMLLSLVSLHILSPELEPSWRVVSEYANGQYGWVLSMMFAFGALANWALTFAIWGQVKNRAGKIGLYFLIAAGIGSAMASIFDIKHPLHNLAGLIGVISAPVSAMLISVSLSRIQAWSKKKKLLLWTANLTWIGLILFIGTLILLIVTYTRAGGDMNAKSAEITTLPAGTIAVVGWANRLLLIINCIWTLTISRQAIRIQNHP